MSSATTADTLTLRHGDATAHVSPVGAALVGLVVGGQSVIPPVDPKHAVPAYVGSVIAPWPNRIEDGSYSFRGNDYQLECNETSRNNALHGFTAHQVWDLTNDQGDRLRLETIIGDTPGYPWRLHLGVTYQMTARGVQVTLVATNHSATTAPFGAAFHPYLVLPGNPSTWTLSMPATTVVIPDPDRLLPTGQVDSPPDGLDFAGGAPLTHSVLDHAFGGFPASATATLSSPGGVAVRIDGVGQGWMQVHRPDSGPLTGSVVVEPQTCPPNAFRDHLDVIDIPAEESTSVTWLVTVTTEGEAP